jgi:hypothetical protein
MVERARTVVLRDEHDGADSRHLSAHLTAAGDLRVEGQDLGPATASLTGGDEYEWVTTVRSAHLSALVALLDADPGASLLDVLEARYTGAAAAELEGILSSDTVPVERSTYSG